LCRRRTRTNLASATCSSFPEQIRMNPMRWIVKLDDSNCQLSPQQMDLLLSLQDQQEEKRIRAFKKAANRHNSLIGRMMLQKSACNALGKDPSSVKFGRTKEGKPYLQDHEAARRGLNSNVSHHGSFIALGMEEKGLVGVDLSPTTPRNNLSADTYFDDMRNCLTKKEWLNVRRAGTTDKELFYAFFVHWALKESYVKAVGIGLLVPMETIEFTIPSEILCLRIQRQRQNVHNPTSRIQRDSEIKVSVDGKERGSWKFEMYMIEEGILMAVAVGPHADATPSYKKVIKDLLESGEAHTCGGANTNTSTQSSRTATISSSSNGKVNVAQRRENNVAELTIRPEPAFSRCDSFSSDCSSESSASSSEEEEHGAPEEEVKRIAEKETTLSGGLRTLSVEALLPEGLVTRFAQLA